MVSSSMPSQTVSVVSTVVSAIIGAVVTDGNSISSGGCVSSGDSSPVDSSTVKFSTAFLQLPVIRFPR